MAGVLVLAALGGFTRYSATVWSDYDSMIEASAYKAPTSARAQVLYARNLFNAGHYEASLSVIDRAAETIPNSAPMLQMNRALIRCRLRQLDDADMDELVSRLAPLTYDPRYLDLYEASIDSLAREQCVPAATGELDRLFSALLENDESLTPGSLSLSHVHYLAGLTALKLHRAEDAMAHFVASVSAQPKPTATMKMAGLMATAQHHAQALELADIALQQVRESRDGMLGNVNIMEDSIREFRRVVGAEIEAAD